MSYPVPRLRTRIELKVANSRFIATVDRADTPKEAQAFIKRVRREMPDASHHVYAFKIGHGSSISEGMSDDGEPSGTSGPPAMAVVRGSGIGNIVLVITRYFGGTKLGTGGLVAAYTAAAQAAIAEVPTEDKIDRQPFHIDMPYALLEPSRRALAQHDVFIENESYGACIRLECLVPETHIETLAEALRELSAGQIHLQPLDR